MLLTDVGYERSAAGIHRLGLGVGVGLGLGLGLGVGVGVGGLGGLGLGLGVWPTPTPTPTPTPAPAPTPTPTPTPIPNRGIHRMGAVLARLLGLNVRALRILGSTALCLAWVAAGRASVCQHAQTQTARLGSVPTRGSSRQLAAARGSSRQLAAAQGSCASSGRARRLCAARPHHWAPSHCLGCPSWPPPNQPADSTAIEHAGLLRGPAQARLPQAVGLVRWPRDRLRCRRSLRAARQ
jgi:hypothetical protein